MSLTVNAKSYVNDTQRTPDSYRYTGPSNDLSTKDYMDLKRTAPKPSGDSLGKARCQVKLTRTMTDGTDPVGDSIFQFDASVPVGSDATEIASALTDLATWLATSAALALVEELDINQ